MVMYRELNRLVPVKICPTCECRNLPTVQFCAQCCDSLVSVAPTECVEDDQMTPFEPDLSMEGKIVCPDCKQENGLCAVRCQYCDCVLR
jgi:hypothetical protein